jgi:hypothetical protein
MRRLIVGRGALGLGLAAVWSLAVAARADEVVLNSGGVVRGHITAKHATTVDIKTSKGTLLVLELSAVKEVKRGAASAQKPAGGKPGSKKSKLTVAEQAWMPKIRTLVSRLASDDRDRSRRARDELLRIQDPDAIPALAHYLQENPDENVRRLFVQIVAGMSGPNAVYYLVAQALFDPSEQVRSEARTSIGNQRADSARPLYINALKSGNPNLVARAARGIKEIGDPKGDAVPYLIENLSSETSQIVETPGDQLFEWVEKGGMARFRVKLVGFGSDYGGFGGFGGGELGTPARGSAPRPIANASPSPQPPPKMGLQLAGTAPSKVDVVWTKNVNPDALDTLVAVTDQKYPAHGYHKDNWRRWWAAEKRSRDLQNNKRSTDHVVGH